MPALATTTASISGLQALELVKVLKDCKKEDFRNIFLNLAVPYMQAGEPGDALKEKLTEKLEVSLWDRWECKIAKEGEQVASLGKQMKLEELISWVETTYEGLEVRDVLKGGQPIFFHAIMHAPGKDQQRKKVLQSTVYNLVEAEPEDKYVDLGITCVRKDDKEANILSGVPPLRLYFK